jgi:hypothetical protein
MEDFGAVLERLTRQFVSDVVEAVRAELAASAPKPRAEKPRIAFRRILRIRPPSAVDSVPVVVSPFEIPVGRPRVRRSRGSRRPRENRPAVVPTERTATFEVVPHPERTNRRLVLTRLG